MCSDTYSISSRRRFLARMIYGLSSFMGLAIAVPASMYMLGTPGSRRNQGWMDAGAMNALPAGIPTEVPVFRIRVDGWKIRTERETAWVLKQADGELVAFSSKCTHLGCAYHWDAAKRMFACPCHGSFFSASGDVIAGPAPRPLDQYVTRIDGNRLWLGELLHRESSSTTNS